MQLRLVLFVVIVHSFAQCADYEKCAKISSATLAQATAMVAITPVVYPLSVMDTHRQQTQKTYPQILKDMTLRKLYAGLTYDAVRLVALKAHRTPLRLAVEGYWAEYVDKTGWLYPVFCAGSFALFETFLLNPLERLRIERITASIPEQKSMFSGFPYRHYVGFYPSFNRQLLSTFSFVYSEQAAKHVILGNPNSINLTPFQLMQVSTLMAISHTVLTQPFELVKTLKQQQGGMCGTTFQIWESRVKTHGFRALYSGAAANTLAYMIRYPIALYFLDYARRVNSQNH